MRRLALATGPVLALLLAAVPGVPAQSQTRSHSNGLGSAATPLGATYVSVSWNWIRSATGYRIQVAGHRDFSDKIVTRKTRNAPSRPAGGRQATVVGHLKDAHYYWVRVRRVSDGHKSSWSAPDRVATKAKWPDPITGVSDVAGPGPGETTIHWTSGGSYTDFFRIKTGLTPFGSAKTPSSGRHAHTFKVSGKKRSFTMTAAQSRAAGARLGSGHHLFFRIVAVRQGRADTQARPYGHLQHATIAGHGPKMNGASLRIASYNVHVEAKDVPGHPWSTRTPLVAQNLARQNPAIVGFQELVPAMWDNREGGIGLQAALQNVGMGNYNLTRTTAYASGAPGDVRILYDPSRVKMVSRCSQTKFSCAVRLPDPGPLHVAPYAKFRDVASGQEFWFVTAHFNHGNNASTDKLRGRQAQAIVRKMNKINGANLPVIVSGDFNSSQTSAGHDAPHQALLGAGYYDSTAAADQVNLQYNSVNDYATTEKPSNYGFGSMIDSIMTLRMPGASRFEEVLTGSPYPSDHNLIYADLRLP
jgi:endonuclease/exonuclease/phosphatase family metal-dependent hydrolase